MQVKGCFCTCGHIRKCKNTLCKTLPAFLPRFQPLSIAPSLQRPNRSAKAESYAHADGDVIKSYP